MFTCKCGKTFKDFRNGGYVQNLIVHCPECAGNETFEVNINGAKSLTTFGKAMEMIRAKIMKPITKFIIVSGSLSKHIRLYSMPINQTDIKKALSSSKNIIDVISLCLN